MNDSRQSNEAKVQSIRSLEIAVEKIVSEMSGLLVGARLKRARTAQGISLRDIAEAAGLSKNSVTRLEQGKEVRSMTILKVCSALGLHVEMLRDPDMNVSAAVHRLADDRWYDLTGFGSGPLGGLDRPLSPIEREAFAKGENIVPLLRLKSRLPQGKVLPSLLELYGPSEARCHPGEEFVFVLRGAALVSVGDAKYSLAQGESIDFWAEELHSYAPEDTGSTLLLSVRVNP